MPIINPAFSWNPSKNLFYCYGCGRGGDVIRFAELYYQVRFPQALALLHQWRSLPPLLRPAADFYRMQLHRHGEAVAYLYQRGVRSPELIEHMRIGYAPGGCLRGWLTQVGYPLQVLRQAGLVTGAGYDAYIHRIVFPLEANLYGRSLSATAPAHRFLPGPKGGLYLWEQVQQCPEVILVEGLFDYASCGRRAFTMSPARWEIISTYTSIGNCVTIGEPSIWLLMPIQTAAASKRRNRWPVDSVSKASMFEESPYPLVTTRTASL
jgi:DNA primase